jgi:hypothetical protein
MRSLFMVVGPLFIVGATLIFLRGIGDTVPPILGAGLAFATGLALLWLAFKPRTVGLGTQAAPGELPVSESYSRTALARLREAQHPTREHS